MNNNKKKNKKITQDFSNTQERRVLNNNYILGPSLLKNSTGDIYAAWDIAKDANTSPEEASYHLPSPFFIKFLPKNYSRSDESMQIFIQEIQRQTECCDWCKVVSFGHDGGDDYMVLKLPRGEFLGKKTATSTVYGDLPKVLDLISTVQTALNTLKKCSIEHGRVEPASIFITENGEVGLLDSIYVSAKQHQLEQGVDYTSTVPNREAIYASPDVCFGRKLSEQDDVFSLACISYHLLSGQHPFGGANSVSALLNKIRPKPIDTLTDAQWQHLEQGMSLKQETRLQTINAFIDGFDRHAKPVKKKIKSTETTIAKQNAEDLIRKQAQTKATSNKVKPSPKKTEEPVAEAIQIPASFLGMQELDFSTWTWISLSLLLGMVIGLIAMSVSISLFNIDFFLLMDIFKGFF